MCQAQQYVCCHCIRRYYVFGNISNSERLEHREMVRALGREGLGDEVDSGVWRQILEHMRQARVLDFTL